jgi:hypothetical protein
MSNIQLQAAPVGLRQNEPPKGEGRKGFPLTSTLGPQLSFLTGNETFEWKSTNLGNAAPSAIMGAWVDATNVATGKFLTLSFNNGFQVFNIEGGTQGYIVATIQGPIDLLITTNNAAGVVATVILYNYNPLFTGVAVSAAAAAAPVSSQSGGSGSGGGGTGGSGGGGFQPSCFTEETRVKTVDGFKPIATLRGETRIVNMTGIWIVELISHPGVKEDVIFLPSGKGRVNLIHGIRDVDGEYVEAGKLWPDATRMPFEGTLYNLHVIRGDRGQEPTEVDRHFIVDPDVVAHNLRPVK